MSATPSRQSGAVAAGHSDKYGQVYVQRIGNTGFDDQAEPVALFRAQDKHAFAVMEFYVDLLEHDPDVPPEQVASARRQLSAFVTWRWQNASKVRTPGVPG